MFILYNNSLGQYRIYSENYTLVVNSMKPYMNSKEVTQDLYHVYHVPTHITLKYYCAYSRVFKHIIITYNIIHKQPSIMKMDI